MSMYRLKSLLLVILPGAIALFIWQFLASQNQSTAFLFGRPSAVIDILVRRILDGTLLTDFFATIIPVLLGFALGNLVGFAAGLGLWKWASINRVARPYLIAIGAVPAFVFGPVFIVWFGTGLLMKVVLVFVSTVLVACFHAHSGAVEVDADFVRLLKSYGADNRGVFLHLILPNSASWLLAGVRLNIGFALLGVFVGEFISSEHGLAHRALIDGQLYNLSAVWAGVFVIALLAVLSYALTARLETWLMPWRPRVGASSNNLEQTP